LEDNIKCNTFFLVLSSQEKMTAYKGLRSTTDAWYSTTLSYLLKNNSQPAVWYIPVITPLGRGRGEGRKRLRLKCC
jgi:hypothetical protein